MQRLTAAIRAAIREQRYPAFVREYVARQFPGGDVPAWVCEGCALAGIELEQVGSGEGGGTAAAAGVQQGSQQHGEQRPGGQLSSGGGG